MALKSIVSSILLASLLVSVSNADEGSRDDKDKMTKDYQTMEQKDSMDADDNSAEKKEVAEESEKPQFKQTGFTFGLGLDYSIDSISGDIPINILSLGSIGGGGGNPFATAKYDSLDNKIGLMLSFQYVWKMGLLLDFQLRGHYVIPGSLPNGVMSVLDTTNASISKYGFGGDVTFLLGYKFSFGSFGIAPKTGIGSSVTLNYTDVTVGPLSATDSLLRGIVSWKIGLEANYKHIAFGFLVGIPIFYGQSSSFDLDGGSGSVGGILGSVGSVLGSGNGYSTLFTNYDDGVKTSLLSWNFYLAWRF